MINEPKNPIDSEIDEILLIDEFDNSIVKADQQIGIFAAQFNHIQQNVYMLLQDLGLKYVMSTHKHIKTCLAANIGIHNLAELHAKNMLTKFKSCNAVLANYTTGNAMYKIDNRLILVEFDLSNPLQSIISAKYMQPVQFNDLADIKHVELLAKQLQILMSEPINDANIVLPYNQYLNRIHDARKTLLDDQAMLTATIALRGFTAFDFVIGMNFYTVNYSPDLSMLFWDRYTITEMTGKSYYIEQHCVIEHTITGLVEAERYITLHKPSKNSMANFLAAKFACLTELTRPAPSNALLDMSTNDPNEYAYESE